MSGVRSPARRHCGRASPSIFPSRFDDFAVEGLGLRLGHFGWLDHLDTEVELRGATGGVPLFRILKRLCTCSLVREQFYSPVRERIGPG